MKGAVEPISAGQYMLLLLSSCLVGDVYIWPQYITEHAGPDALLVLAAGTAAAMALAGLQAWWSLSTGHASLMESLADTWGHAPGLVLTGATLLLGMGLDAVLLALYSDMLQVFYYPATPRWATMILLVATASWLASRTVSGLARNVQIWLPPALITFLAVSTASFSNASQLAAAVPSGSLPPLNFAEATAATWFLFANAALPATLLPHVRMPNPRRLVAITILVVAMQGLLLLMLLSLVVGTLGIRPTSEIAWPIVYVFSLVVMRTFFLRGVGLFIVLSWTVVAVLYGATHIQNVLLNLGPVSVQQRTRWVALVGVILLVVAHEISSATNARDLLLHDLTPLNFLWMLVLMPLTALVWVVRRTIKAPRSAPPPPDPP